MRSGSARHRFALEESSQGDAGAWLVEVGCEHTPEPADEHFDGFAQLLAVREAREVDRTDAPVDVVGLVVERERDGARQLTVICNWPMRERVTRRCHVGACWVYCTHADSAHMQVLRT
jgi:hypothetical protein